MISEEAVKEFKEIWKKQYHQNIGEEEAVIMATRLLNLFKAIYRPIPVTNRKNVEKLV